MTTIDSNIYLAPRGDDFKDLIRGILVRGGLKEKYIDLLTNENSMEQYGNAFTAATAHAEHNYERFEQIGDLAANHFIVSYSYRRFPQLDCTAGVKVVARLRINYGAKQFFSKIAEEKLGFWPFISAARVAPERTNNKKYLERDKKDLLEDVLEAFIGCTEFLLDKAFRPGVGYGIVYDILDNIFDEIDISLEYEDLFDAKTRLKETFDQFTDTIGKLIYYPVPPPTEEKICRIYNVPVGYTIPNVSREPPNLDRFFYNHPEGLIATAKSHLKADAEQKASKIALQYFKERGIFRKPPPEYCYFAKK